MERRRKAHTQAHILFLCLLVCVFVCALDCLFVRLFVSVAKCFVRFEVEGRGGGEDEHASVLMTVLELQTCFLYLS